MNYLKRQIHTALTQLILPYDGETPFHHYLKHSFQKNKNWGSKDRRNYRSICYAYWRNYAHLCRLDRESMEECLLEIIESVNWENPVHPYVDYQGFISQEIDFNALKVWMNNPAPVFFLVNPDVKFDFSVYEKRGHHTIELEKDSDHSLLISDGVGIIQDISSTLCIEKVLPYIENNRVWDCCAGAGGKSIAIQLLGKANSIVGSDVRESILINYRKRFQALNINPPKTIKIDLSNRKDVSQLSKFDFILADMPCSGSGTWRRTPENVAFFEKGKIFKIAENQLQYLENIAERVNVGGYIYYLTCSIFTAENERVIEEFTQTHRNFVIEFQTYFGGPSENGDFIFGGLLRREN